MSKHQETQSVVFDSEPLVMWIDQRSGASTVEKYITDTYHSHISTVISRINLTEVYYTCANLEDRQFAQTQVNYLQRIGVGVVEAGTVWEQVAIYKHEYTPNFLLGDAFALATATEQNRPLLTGDDHHWDEPETDGHDILRIP